MQFIRPTTITDAKLTSSTVPETDFAAWNAATSYTVGDKVIRTQTHRIYQCAIAGINATTPEVAALLPTPRWVETAPTNRWGMFDSSVGTATTATTSLTVVLAPGKFNSLALLAITAETVSVSLDVPGEGVVYSASMDLYGGNIIGSWYQYFYEPVYQQDSLVITDLVDASLLDIPAYSTGTLTITFTGASISVGALVVGLYAELGDTLYQPSIGIIDFSRKDVDAFGRTTVLQRTYKKTMKAEVLVLAASVDYVARILAQYRSTPLVWVGAGSQYTSMIIYGFYKDWDIQIEGPSASRLQLQVEGLS